MTSVGFSDYIYGGGVVQLLGSQPRASLYESFSCCFKLWASFMVDIYV